MEKSAVTSPYRRETVVATVVTSTCRREIVRPTVELLSFPAGHPRTTPETPGASPSRQSTPAGTTSGASRVMTFSSGTTTGGDSGAIMNGGGAAASGSGGSVSLTVGNGVGCRRVGRDAHADRRHGLDRRACVGGRRIRDQVDQWGREPGGGKSSDRLSVLGGGRHRWRSRRSLDRVGRRRWHRRW